MIYLDILEQALTNILICFFICKISLCLEASLHSFVAGLNCDCIQLVNFQVPNPT